MYWGQAGAKRFQVRGTQDPGPTTAARAGGARPQAVRCGWNWVVGWSPVQRAEIETALWANPTMDVH
jgi:hypothetical protein